MSKYNIRKVREVRRDAKSTRLSYRLFQDSGHAWLEVPRAEVVASGAAISAYSYYDEATGLAYLEEDCDLPAFLAATECGTEIVGKTVWSSRPRELAPCGDRAVTA